MAPKPKAKDDDEDISQLRQPITIHGKPVEQILNSIHYGSPELQSLLLNECDIIFECKVCRALFRDLPNFIAHKRRYCSKTAADNNYFSLSKLPNEKVIVVQPQPVENSKVRAARNSAQPSSSSSSCSNLEDSLRRLRSDGSSHACQVYNNAAAKLQHQKDNAKITTIRTTEIPGNSNGVFVNVSTTPVNIHERHSIHRDDDAKSSPSSVIKTVTSKAGERNKTRVRPNLRSKSTGKAKDNSLELTDMLMRELKVIQNKTRNRTQPQPQKPEKLAVKEAKSTAVPTDTQASLKVEEGQPGEEQCQDNVSVCSKASSDAGLVKVARRNVKATLEVKTERGETVASDSGSSKVSSENEMDAVVTKEIVRQSKRSLICSKCRGIFSSRTSLKYHIKIQHAVKRTFYPCPLCTCVYSYLSALIRHLQVNHDKTKTEVDVLRPKIRDIAFTKRVPVQQGDSVMTAKRKLMGSRHSLRDKDRVLKGKISNAPYIYSLGTIGKKKPAKESILEDGGKDAKGSADEQVSKLDATVVKSNKYERGEEQSDVSKSCVKSTRSQAKIEVSETKSLTTPVNKLPPSPPVKSPSIDIDSVMQTCKKCLRLFGRKATFEKHVKLCEGSPNAMTSSEGSNENRSSSTPGVGNSSSISTRNRRKEVVQPVSLSSMVSPISNSNLPTKRSRHTDGNKDEVDRVERLDTSRTTRQDRDTKVIPSLSVRLVPCQSASPVKVDNSVRVSQDQSANKSLGTNTSVRRVLQDTPVESKTDKGNGEDCENKCPSVTRLKTKLSDSCKELPPEEGGGGSLSALAADSSRKDLLQSQDKISKESMPVSGKSQSSKLEVETRSRVNKDSNIPERPRRKRKVPSRNIDAVEFLQKIHRLERDVPPARKLEKITSIETPPPPLPTPSPSVATYKKNQAEACGKKVDEGRKEAVTVDGEGVNGVARNRATANKVFVLRSDASRKRSKLECYDHSKVDKLVDPEKNACLKCGAQFSFVHNLKRHIVRLHLKWSRFQCKLCSYNCFDKSECNTHIIRCHRGNRKPERNHMFNTLIVDLAKKGSKAMTLKKHRTLLAKSRMQGKDDNIYKNRNAQKVPRLSERTSKLDSSHILSEEKELEKHKEHKREIKVLKQGASVKKSSPIVLHTNVNSVSHLVARVPRASIPQSPFVEPSLEKSKQTASLNIAKSSEKEAVTCKTSGLHAASHSNSSSTAGPGGRRAVLPFNISTRNSPRVFDTTPYSREEAVTAEEIVSNDNDTILHTRQGANTKTLAEDSVREQEPKKGVSVSVDNPDFDYKEHSSCRDVGLDSSSRDSDLHKTKLSVDNDIEDSESRKVCVNEVISGISCHDDKGDGLTAANSFQCSNLVPSVSQHVLLDSSSSSSDSSFCLTSAKSSLPCSEPDANASVVSETTITSSSSK